jgi:hypothetical protein
METARAKEGAFSASLIEISMGNGENELRFKNLAVSD